MVLEVDTPHGTARAHLQLVERARGALVLGHGAAGGVSAPDLVTAADVAVSEGLGVALVEQPYRVAGRRSPAPAGQLDAAWSAVVRHLCAEELEGLPLVAGGRSLGARVACRTAGALGAVGVLPGVPAAAAAAALGRTVPEPSARARRGDGPDAGRAGRARSVRPASGRGAPHRGPGPGRPRPEGGPRRSGRCRACLASRRRRPGAMSPASNSGLPGDCFPEIRRGP